MCKRDGSQALGWWLSQLMLLFSVIGRLAISPAWAATRSGTAPSAVVYTMANGMQVILKENHSSPMIASVAFVRSGSKYETELNNGVTHFLEHLLFDGTATRTQEQISDRIKNLGGYINAFTRKELTGYLSLVPAEYIAEALDIQQDMLFNSIFPEDRFPKERKIVIEEIRKDADSPDNASENFHDRWAYQGSPFARPVMGYENLVAAFPREEVIEYYHTYYQPNNMILLVIGDFAPAAMRERVEESFGRHPARPLPPRPAVTVPSVHGRMVQRTTAPIGETRVDVHIRLPLFTEASYDALALWAEILGDETLSPLQRNLVEGDHAPATQVSATMETQAEFSALHIWAATDVPANADTIVALIARTLAALPKSMVSAADVRLITTRLEVQDIFLREKLHYYALMKAPMLVVTGYDFVDRLPARMAQVTPAQLQKAAAQYLTVNDYVATIITPPDTTVAGPPPGHPEHSRYEKRVLANGLAAIVKSNPDSRVFAINVLGKNRAATEPEGLAGISDFVNRMLMSGTQTRDKDQVGRALAAIGADLTTNDNPNIPYDDYYTTPQYTFIKFATIDGYANAGAQLLAELVGHASFPAAEVEQTRRQVLGLLTKEQNSTNQTCRRLFCSSLFGDEPLAKPILGTPESVARFTTENLLRHRRTLYAPENMILTCVTNLPGDSAFAIIESSFGRIPTGTPPGNSAVAPPKPPSGVQIAHQPMQKEQVYIYLGGVLPGAADSDAAAIIVANQILSARLGDHLREKLGLAYSVGSSVNFDRDFGWYCCTMGTGKANYIKARDGILNEILRLQQDTVSAEELATAQNTLWGSSLTARLSRVNQAYFMGVDLFLGRGFDYADKMSAQMRAVAAADIARVARRWFDTQNYVLATVGNLE
ncbi:MAG: insulinase family protein [candidate division Zixibacteria bacterium]|nr:insulinase family protein [candidate division Zixibacteria bacterium]